MQTTCVIFLFLIGLAFSQVDLITDPGLSSLSGDQCSPLNQWSFRSDYVWNDTSSYVNPRCAAYYEIPTPFIPGISKGNQTNINHAAIPPLPTVVGATNGFTAAAGVVDMNSACRAALWAPFTLTGTPISLVVYLQLWVRSNDQIQQFLLPSGSEVPTADLLQYLHQPDGLLGEDLSSFPPLVEETNQVRIDVMAPQSNNDFYDVAFSLISSQIAVNIPISHWDSGNVVPASGTNGAWLNVTQDLTASDLSEGTYALRVASAQSQIGVSWGISDVHIKVKYAKKRSPRDSGLYQMESASEEIAGSMTHIVPPRKSRW